VEVHRLVAPKSVEGGFPGRSRAKVGRHPRQRHGVRRPSGAFARAGRERTNESRHPHQARVNRKCQNESVCQKLNIPKFVQNAAGKWTPVMFQTGETIITWQILLSGSRGSQKTDFLAAWIWMAKRQ